MPQPPKGKPKEMPLRPPEVPLKDQIRALTEAAEAEAKGKPKPLRLFPNALQFEQVRAYYSDLEKAKSDAEALTKQAERAFLANLSGIYAAAGVDMQDYEHVTMNLARADKAYLEYKVRETPPEEPEKKDGEGAAGTPPSEPASTPPTADSAATADAGAAASVPDAAGEGVSDGSS
jgi:hypothetical protein